MCVCVCVCVCRGYMALMITGVVYSLICGAVVTRVSRGNSHITIRDDARCAIAPASASEVNPRELESAS